jgi:tetratricopeptide (TPR) repeat protein
MTLLAWEPAIMPHESDLRRPELPGDEIARACRLYQQALALCTAGRSAEAGPLAERALEIFERESGPDHPDVANLLLCLAGIREESGDLDEAERLGRRAVEILEPVEDDGPDIPRLRVQVLGALAGVLRNQGRYGEAEPLLRRALALSESRLGPDDLQTAALLNDLGILHKCQGRYDEAEPLYFRALDIIDAAVGPDDLQAASLYHNLGGLEHARGRAAQGEPPARWGLRIRERALGADHPHVAADKAALAAILDAQGRYDEAEELYRQALAVFEGASPAGSTTSNSSPDVQRPEPKR